MKSNSSSEHLALKELRANKELVVLKADKSNTSVVMDSEAFFEERTFG